MFVLWPLQLIVSLLPEEKQFINHVIIMEVDTGLRTCILERALVLQDGQHRKMESELIANGKSRPNSLSLHRIGKHVGYSFKISK